MVGGIERGTRPADGERLLSTRVFHCVWRRSDAVARAIVRAYLQGRVCAVVVFLLPDGRFGALT